MNTHDRMDEALASVEGDLDAALRTATTLIRELKKAKAAAAKGTVRDLQRSLEAADGLVKETAAAVAAGDVGWAFDVAEYLASGGWAKEVIAAAAERGLAITESDDRLVCYPSLVKVVPADASIEIDRRRDRQIRPSVVVESLADRQARPPRFRPEPFLEALQEGYTWVVERGGQRSFGAVVRLVDVWGVLTLMPGSNRDYTKPEFARDLYLLDQTGRTSTKAGRTMRFSASTGTRAAGVLSTVAEDGRQVSYWGVAFR